MNCNYIGFHVRRLKSASPAIKYSSSLNVHLMDPECLLDRIVQYAVHDIECFRQEQHLRTLDIY